MISAGIPLMSPEKKNFFCNQALVTISDVAQRRRLKQAAAQRRGLCCWMLMNTVLLSCCVEYLRLSLILPACLIKMDRF